MLTWLLLIAAQAPADVVYQVRATAPITLTVPARPEGEGHFVRVAGKKWVRVQGERQGNTLRFRLDPARWPGGETLLVVGKQPGTVLDDEQAPRVTNLVIDGVRSADGSEVDLDWRVAPPKKVSWRFADRSRLDLDGLRVTVNGRTLSLKDRGITATPSADGKAATVSVFLSWTPGYRPETETRLTLSLPDTAPVRNTVERKLHFRLLTPPADGKRVEARVDSNFAGYSAAPLIDGEVMEPKPGVSTVGVTWASAETRAPHWAALVFDQPRTLREIELFWAYYDEQYWTAARYQVQVWDGERWMPVTTADGVKPAKSTVHRFTPVKTAAIRVWMPVSGGHPARPDLLWLTEMRVE